MSAVNGNCVKRSNALLGYSPSFSYYDVRVSRNSTALSRLWSNLQLMFFALSFKFAFLKYLFRNFYLPKPGQLKRFVRPEDGYLYVTMFGESDRGAKFKSELKFFVDAAYLDTARMLCESVFLLVEDRKKGGPGARKHCGVVSPAAGLGGAIIDRLAETGSSYKLERL